MAITNPYIVANRGGIPRLEATGVTTSGTSPVVSTYTFKSYAFMNYPFNGLVAVKLPANSSAATSIVFSSSNSTITLSKLGGAAAASDVANAGVYLVWYENDTNTLQLI